MSEARKPGEPNAVPIGRFQKNSREVIRAELRTFKGVQLADLRVMALANTVELPTKAAFRFASSNCPSLLTWLRRRSPRLAPVACSQADQNTRWSAASPRHCGARRSRRSHALDRRPARKSARVFFRLLSPRRAMRPMNDRAVAGPHNTGRSATWS